MKARALAFDSSISLPEENMFERNLSNMGKRGRQVFFFHLASCHGEEMEEMLGSSLHPESKMHSEEGVTAGKQMQIC